MIRRAIVSDARDPQKKGRLRVTIPSQSASGVSDWIWPVVGSGYVVPPKPGDMVWVAFENGDNEVPVWLGATKVTDGYNTLLERVEALEQWVYNHDHQPA